MMEAALVIAAVAVLTSVVLGVIRRHARPRPIARSVLVSAVDHTTMDAAGAVEVRNDYGELGYGGAAPPAGDIPHRYVYTVFAVDEEKLDIPKEASPAYVGFNLTFHTLARAAIRPTFRVEA